MSTRLYDFIFGTAYEKKNKFAVEGVFVVIKMTVKMVSKIFYFFACLLLFQLVLMDAMMMMIAML